MHEEYAGEDWDEEFHRKFTLLSSLNRFIPACFITDIFNELGAGSAKDDEFEKFKIAIRKHFEGNWG